MGDISAAGVTGELKLDSQCGRTYVRPFITFWEADDEQGITLFDEYSVIVWHIGA